MATTPNNADKADSLATTPSTPLLHLTPRERAVLQLIFEGLSSQEVADRLSVSKRTISFNLAAIYQKLGVQNRLQAVIQARQRGLLDAPAAETGNDSTTHDTP